MLDVVGNMGDREEFLLFLPTPSFMVLAGKE